MGIKKKNILRNEYIINNYIIPKVNKLKTISENMDNGLFLNQFHPNTQLLNFNLKQCITIYESIIQKGKLGLVKFEDEIESLHKTCELFSAKTQPDFIVALHKYQDFAIDKNNHLRNKKIIFGLMLTLGLAGLITTIVLACVCPWVLVLAIPAKIWIVSFMLSIPLFSIGGLAFSSTVNHPLEDAMTEISHNAFHFFPSVKKELPDITLVELDVPLIPIHENRLSA